MKYIDNYGKEIKGEVSTKINDVILIYCLSNDTYKNLANSIIKDFYNYAKVISELAEIQKGTAEFEVTNEDRNIKYDAVINNVNILNDLAVKLDKKLFLENTKFMSKFDIGQEVLLYFYLHKDQFLEKRTKDNIYYMSSILASIYYILIEKSINTTRTKIIDSFAADLKFWINIADYAYFDNRAKLVYDLIVKYKLGDVDYDYINDKYMCGELKRNDNENDDFAKIIVNRNIINK